jgi:hypothetical protein
MGPELIARIGLNRDKYSKGLADAEKDFKTFTANVGSHGRNMSGQLVHQFREINEAIKGFGAAEVFRKVIDGFKSISEWARKFGDQTDENTRAASRWGDAYKAAASSVMSVVAKGFGMAVRGMEYTGGFLKGEGLDKTDKLAASDDAAAAAEAQRDAFLKKNNAEQVKRLRQEIAAIELEASGKLETSGERVSELYRQQAALVNETSKLADDEVERRLVAEKAIAEINKKIGEEQRRSAEEQAKAQEAAAAKEAEQHALRLNRIAAEKLARSAQVRTIAEIQEKKDTSTADRSRLSVQELTNIGRFEPGVSIAVTDAAEQGRQAVSLKNQANQLRLSGDQTGAAALQSQSDTILHGLAGPTGPLRHSEDPDQSVMSEQLVKANEHLKDIDDKITSITISQ